ncbi:MAG: methyltransferase family protein [Promethearchaeia archaeon]
MIEEIMIISIMLTFELILAFLARWMIIFRKNSKKPKKNRLLYKIIFVLWIIPIFLIPILTSSFFSLFFKTKSYFREYWIWFLLIGIIFLIICYKIGNSVIQINKKKGKKLSDYPFNTKGPYEIVRHPILLVWTLFYLALVFTLDSFYGLIIAPIFLVMLHLEANMAESRILKPRYKKNYEKYMEKTPNKVIPPPYNTFLILLAILITYIGILNWNYLF